MNVRWVLGEPNASAAADEFSRQFDGDLTALENALHQAARGSSRAARQYLNSWRELAVQILSVVQQERPDLVVRDESGRLRVVGAGGSVMDVTFDVLLAAAPRAPFSSWVASEGLARGLALGLLADVREILPGSTPLTPPPGLWRAWGDPTSMRRALYLIEAALVDMTESATQAPLRRVMELFGMGRTELARLFGVKRQAVEQWDARGVPAERQAKLATVLAIAEFLSKKLRPGTVPGVARTRAAAYGNRTMLDMIAADEHDALLADIRASFDWSATA